MVDVEQALTPREAGAIFHVERQTVIRWIKAGKLPSFRTLGGHHRVLASDVVRLVDTTRGS